MYIWNQKKFILKGRRPTTKGIDCSLNDSVYADDIAVWFKRELRKILPIIIESFLKIWNEDPYWPL